MAKNTCLNKVQLTEAIKSEDIFVHPVLLDSLSYCLVKSGQIIRSCIDELLEDYNLVAPHLSVLILLINVGEINQLSLGEMMGIDKATMVKLIDALENQTLVERIVDKNDRRAKIIKVTKKGHKFAEKMTNERKKIENELLSDFSKADIESMKRLLPQMLISLKNKTKK